MKDALKELIESSENSKSSKFIKDSTVEERPVEPIGEDKFREIIDKIVTFVINKSEEEEMGLIIFAMILSLDEYLAEIEEFGAMGIREEIVERLREEKGDLFHEWER